MTSQPPLAPARLNRRKEHLMDEIVTPLAAPRAHPSRAWRLRLITAAVVVVLLTLGITLIQTLGGGKAGLGRVAFAVTPAPHGNVAIRVVSTEASAQQMTNQLHHRGIDITINAVPVTPALVGTWLGFGVDGSDTAQQRMERQIGGHDVTIVVPASTHGEFDLGRAAAPGEQVGAGGTRNALSPGAPLACKSLSGTDPETARSILTSLGYTIDGWTTSYGPLDPPYLTSPPAGRVTEIFIHDFNGKALEDIIPDHEHNVVVQVTPRKSPEYDRRLHQGFAPNQPIHTC